MICVFNIDLTDTTDIFNIPHNYTIIQINIFTMFSINGDTHSYVFLQRLMVLFVQLEWHEPASEECDCFHVLLYFFNLQTTISLEFLSTYTGRSDLLLIIHPSFMIQMYITTKLTTTR